jgi:aquaporin Z
VKSLVMEAVGTLFLVAAIGLSGNPLAIGLTLAVMIYIGGHVSGGHYNPAVSLAVLIRGKLEAGRFVTYVVAQIAGAILGALAVWVLRGETFAPGPAIGAEIWQSFLAEVMFTFVLASTVLAVATTKATEGNYVYGFAIGLAVTAGAFCAGPISGGALNPAVGVGPILVHVLAGGGGAANLLLYLTAPFLGGALAGWFWRFVNVE